MNKTAIKNFSVWAREKLIEDIVYQAGLLGVTEAGAAEPLPQSTNDLQFFDIGTKEYAQVSGAQIRQRNDFVYAIKRKAQESNFKTAFQYVVEEVAYTWFNRLIAIRFMEINDYLPSQIRVLSSENPAKNEPDFVTSPFDTNLPFTDKERAIVLNMKEQNRGDELFRLLFIKQCNALTEVLPELFEHMEDYTELLLTISYTDPDGVVYHLVHDIDEQDFNISTLDENGEPTGQVQIIGWLYQYYNSVPKDKVFANLKKNIKVTKENIPAATQLFTPDWIVRYMVENSLGRIYVDKRKNEGVFADGRGADEMTWPEIEAKRIANEKYIAEQMGWKYFLPEAEQIREVQGQLEKLQAEYANKDITEIKVIDPCMGSGHILVYAFDVLMQIYESQGYTQRDAAQSIVQNNLFGLEIDKRAYQLAYFAVMMKARQYDRRFLERKINPNLYVIQDSQGLNDRAAFALCGEQKAVAERLYDSFKDASEYGSLLEPEVSMEELVALKAKLEEVEGGMESGDLFQRSLAASLTASLSSLIGQATALVQKYHVVVTNPPYMGAGNMNNRLSSYVKDNFPDSKSDISTAFMERAIQLCLPCGYMTMINIPVWMFISSYEKLRKSLLANNTIINLIQPGRGIFGSDFGTTTFVFRKIKINGYYGTYFRLFDRSSEVESIEMRENSFLQRKGLNISCQDSFSNIQGTPVAYWVSPALMKAFSGNKMEDFAEAHSGMSTTDNERFLRIWTEVSIENINFTCTSLEEASLSPLRWYPYNKGGDFRRWYGNNTLVVNWLNDGAEIKHWVVNNPKDPKTKSWSRRIFGTDFFFREGITWSSVTIGAFSCRCYEKGFIFDSGANALFPFNEKDRLYLAGLLNTKLANMMLGIINPTINTGPGTMNKVPVKTDLSQHDHVTETVSACISLSRADWDSFETSWDFTRHPLVPTAAEKQEQMDSQFASSRMEKFGRIAWHFEKWQQDCNDRFNQLKANEEELNRIFIDIYGLQDELTPEVEDKDVTVRKADLGRDIRSLISYAVGCMFGRYSLYQEGLIFAGGEWDYNKFENIAWQAEGQPDPMEFHRAGTHFFPDQDNVIPICDDEYFPDDIVGRFVNFISIVYGKETLEENLQFIADALGNKGATSREVIRNYFLNDFMKDHVKIYQKRPIYWLFDSGKENGFKALVYMHRWNADTIGNLRVEYLHRAQQIYEREIERMQDTIEKSTNAREVSAAEKRKDKLTKQLKECRDYDAKIAHLALSRIDIDLDDGVKVNYQKVQTGQDGKVLEVLYKLK